MITQENSERQLQLDYEALEGGAFFISGDLHQELDSWASAYQDWQDEVAAAAGDPNWHETRTLREVSSTFESMLFAFPDLASEALAANGQQDGNIIRMNGRLYQVRQNGLLLGLATYDEDEQVEFSYGTARHYVEAALDQPTYNLHGDEKLVQKWNQYINDVYAELRVRPFGQELDFDAAQVLHRVTKERIGKMPALLELEIWGKENPFSAIFQSAVEVIESVEHNFAADGTSFDFRAVACGQRYIAVTAEGLNLMRFGELNPQDELTDAGGFAVSMSLGILQAPERVDLNLGFAPLKSGDKDSLPAPIAWRIGMRDGYVETALFSELVGSGNRMVARPLREASEYQVGQLKDVTRLLAETSMLRDFSDHKNQACAKLLEKINDTNVQVKADAQKGLSEIRKKIVGTTWTVDPFDVML